MLILGIIVAAGALAAAGLAIGGASLVADTAQEAIDRYGELNPETFEAILAETLPPSAFEQIKQDAALREAQMSALDSFREIEEGGGMDVRDRANLNRVWNQAAQQDQANRAQLLEDMQQRGMGGSGAHFASQLQSSQGAANMRHQGALDVAADARQRYFEAIGARAGLAGNIRSQDWDEQSEVARARDNINKLNWDRRFDVQKENNRGRQQNYENEKGLLDRQTDLEMEKSKAWRDGMNQAGGAVSGASTAASGEFAKRL